MALAAADTGVNRAAIPCPSVTGIRAPEQDQRLRYAALRGQAGRPPPRRRGQLKDSSGPATGARHPFGRSTPAGRRKVSTTIPRLAREFLAAAGHDGEDIGDRNTHATGDFSLTLGELRKGFGIQLAGLLKVYDLEVQVSVVRNPPGWERNADCSWIPGSQPTAMMTLGRGSPAPPKRVLTSESSPALCAGRCALLGVLVELASASSCEES